LLEPIHIIKIQNPSPNQVYINIIKIYACIHFDQTSNIHNYINPKNLIKIKIKEGFYTSFYRLMELRWVRGGWLVRAHVGGCGLRWLVAMGAHQVANKTARKHPSRIAAHNREKQSVGVVWAALGWF